MQATFPIACHTIRFPVLCAVLLFERLAGCMILATGALSLDEHMQRGEGFAARTVGYFLAASYAAAIPSGLLADRCLGPVRAVRIAVLLLACGYALACIGTDATLLGGAALLVVGSGLFRPSVATLTGRVATPPGSDPFRRLYFIVNIAYLTAPIVAGALHVRYGLCAILTLASALLGLAGLLLTWGGDNVLVGSHPRQVVRNSPAMAQQPRTRALAGLLGGLVLFGVVLHQIHGTLLFWARDDARHTLLDLPLLPEWFALLPGGLVLLYTPLLSALSRRLACRARPVSLRIMLASGALFAAAAYGLMTLGALLRQGGVLASPLWLVGCLLLLMLTEALIWPLAMRLVGEWVPSSRQTQAHALFCLATALGHWLSGEVGALWSRWPHAWFFAGLTGLCVGIAGCMWWLGSTVFEPPPDNR